MTVGDLPQLISSIGIPACAFAMSGWFIKYMFDRFTSMMTRETEAHKEEVNTLQKTIENNTIAITELTALLRKD